MFLDKIMYTEKHLIELFNDHDYIWVILHSVLYKKQNLTGYIQYYKKMVGQTQRPWVRQNPTSWLTQRQTEKKSFHQIRVTLRNIYKKQHGARPCVEKMQLIFFVPPNEELEGTLHPQKFGCTPKNEGKRIHVPPDEKTCGHAVGIY